MEGSSPFVGAVASMMPADIGSSYVMSLAERQQLDTLVRGIFGDDPEMWLQCTTQFRKMLSSEKNPPIEAGNWFSFFHDIPVIYFV